MGGLGLHKAKDKNFCNLANLAWRTITNPTTPWAQLIINAANTKNTRNTSFIWKSIQKGREICSKGINWQLHHHSNMNIWETNWIPNLGSLRNTIEGPLSKNDYLRNIFDGKKWHLANISLNLPNDIKDFISKIKILVQHPNNDIPIWSVNTKGIFTTKTCYSLINTN